MIHSNILFLSVIEQHFICMLLCVGNITKQPLWWEEKAGMSRNTRNLWLFRLFIILFFMFKNVNSFTVKRETKGNVSCYDEQRIIYCNHEFQYYFLVRTSHEQQISVSTDISNKGHPRRSIYFSQVLCILKMPNRRSVRKRSWDINDSYKVIYHNKHPKEKLNVFQNNWNCYFAEWALHFPGTALV